MNSVYMALEQPLAEGDLPTARARLEEKGRFVPALLHTAVGTRALSALLLAATVLEDLRALRRLAGVVQGQALTDALPPLLWQEAQRVLAELDAVAEPRADVVPGPQIAADDTPQAGQSVAPWPAFLAAVAAGSSEGTAAIEEQLECMAHAGRPRCSTGQPAGRLGESGRRGGLAGSRCEAVGYAAPEIALRAGPSAQTYAELLDEIGAYRSRWASPERAAIALDFVDRLFLAACPDQLARATLAYDLLEPLWRHQQRLNEVDLAFTKRLSGEMDVLFSWQEWVVSDGDQESPLSDLPSMKVLLYSLDEAVLTRCVEEIQHLAPGVDAARSSGHVDSAQLRQKARSADLVVIATRCAKYAATGFITQHARTQHIFYADGSGSASMLQDAADAPVASLSPAFVEEATGGNRKGVTTC
ncbi:hypothetical protein [Streptomyces sp. NPDC016845]|uniref:hypothetical protein n=1 Tax=Streptomyces sp. NPDC016845 TaxID=3364972 RepID=UPI00379110C0